MKNLFEKYGILISDEKISILNGFAEYLKEVNEVINLTTVTDIGDMWIKHFLDSLVGEEFFEKNSKCCEIGSGGGFPSVPLLIFRDDLNFTLIESTGKKCDYLNSVINKFSLSASVINGRAEELGKDEKQREKYDFVTARAVARLNTLCEYCMPFVKVGGCFIAYKGDAQEELKEAENAIKTLGGRVKTVKKVSLPDGIGERNVIVIEKIKNTPFQYPRGQGKERKKPL